MKKWDTSVTHVIASTDENGACKRTLKVLLGILEGKWILNVECKSYSYMKILFFFIFYFFKIIINDLNSSLFSLFIIPFVWWGPGTYGALSRD